MLVLRSISWSIESTSQGCFEGQSACTTLKNCLKVAAKAMAIFQGDKKNKKRESLVYKFKQCIRIGMATLRAWTNWVEQQRLLLSYHLQT